VLPLFESEQVLTDREEKTMSRDYIPYNDLEFNQWFKFICQYAGSKTSGSTPEWTHIPQAVITKLNSDYADWYTVYGKTLSPHTPLDTEVKNNMKKEMTAMMRPFANQYLRFPPVTDEDRRAMGIPNHDEKPTPVPAPTSQAEADIMFPGIHMLELVKIRKVGNLSDDPRSDYGVRIHYGILDAVNSKWRITAPPATGEDLPHSVFTREKKCCSTSTANRARPSTSASATKRGADCPAPSGR
jgi:hypothetical protein